MDIIEEVEINTLNDYLAWVEQEKVRINNPSGNTRGLFYRGHSDYSFQLKPSAYREDDKGLSYRKTEHHLYNEMLRSEVSAFVEDKTIFERLIRMQHHGLPTRLLDVTEDPLVALYFACKNEFSKDGEVFFFNIDPTGVMFSSTVPSTAFVGLEKPLSVLEMAKNININFINYLANGKSDRETKSDFDREYHVLLDRIIAYRDINTNFINEQDFDSISSVIYCVESMIDFFYKKWNSELDSNGKQLNSKEASKENVEEILQNYQDLVFLSKFRKDIDVIKDLIVKKWSEHIDIPYVNQRSLFKFLQQFLFFYFVYPPMNNERIQRQKGAFLICPQQESAHHSSLGFFKPSRVKIKNENKLLILNELSNIGITENYLFPSLDERAKEIKEQYQPYEF